MGPVVFDHARDAGLRIVELGGLQLIAGKDAHVFLDYCVAYGARVLGVEGFRIVHGRAQPELGAIADLSGVTAAADSIAEARRFIERVGSPDLMFDFALAQP